MNKGYIIIVFDKSEHGKTEIKLWWESNYDKNIYTSGFEYENSSVKGSRNIYVSNPVTGESERDVVCRLLGNKEVNNLLFRESNSTCNLSSLIYLYDFYKKQNGDERSFSFICHQN